MISSKHVEPLHGVILAGIQPWGGCPLDQLCSRPLLPLAGRPVVWFVLDWFRRSGVRRVTICGESSSSVLREYLGDGRYLDLDLDYVEDPVPRGTAGCIRDAAMRSLASEVVAVDATLLTDLSLDELLATHYRNQASLTVVAGKNPGSPGQNHLQPAGIYIISRSALEHVPATTFQDIKEMWIPRLYQNGLKVASHAVDTRSYLRVLNGKSYLSASSWAVQRLLGETRLGPGYRRIGDALVHSSARIAPSARLVGACVIGPDCRVRDGSTIIGPSVLGPGSLIGPSCIVSQTAAWNGVQVGAGCVIDRTILSFGTAIDPGTIMRETVLTGRHSPPTATDLYWWPCQTSGAVRKIDQVKSLRPLLHTSGPAGVAASLPA